MRIAITTTRAPFVRGGAEALERDLAEALRRHGHEVEVIAFPFRYGPPEVIARSVDIWAAEDLAALSGPSPDQVIALKFPAYYARHPNTAIWLVHQHRAFYELWDDTHADAASAALRVRAMALDTATFAAASRRFAISRNVAQRAERFNGAAFMPLYPPPTAPESYYCAESQPFIFAPSRLETLKRQDLLIKAMAHVKSPVVALIAGDGGQRPTYERLIHTLGLQDKVRLLGAVDDATLRAGYANATAIFFGPRDEDYGYVTLEAMLSAKPVLTCNDSGGPLEFVRHEETGLVVPPEPQAVAAAIDHIHGNPGRAREWGQAGRTQLGQHQFSWDRVVAALLGH